MRALEGRRIWFVGIGGAGLSSYAILAQAWGAEVAGWDRVETPYLEHVRAAGVPVTIAPDPTGGPSGWETVVSTAFAGRVEGRTRADFLSELVSLRRSIVVSGAHGKTTTAAMIAFVLERLGQDPAYLIGGEVPQLGGNAGTGEGWLVVEGDESDRTVQALHPEIAVITNVDLDHHTTFASRFEVEELFARWAGEAPQRVRGDELAPAEIELAVPGEHNRRNAATALAVLELAGVARPEAERELSRFEGVARRLERRGEVGEVAVYDSYAHHPAELAADLEAARALDGGRLLVLFQPHLYSRTRHLARDFARTLTAADAVAIAEIYPAREEPIEGVTGKLVVDTLAQLRPGMPIAWTPAIEDGARFLARRAHQGDTILILGAGDVDRAAPLLLEALG